MDVDFCVDAITSSLINGWAWLPAQPDIPLTIELIASDGEVIYYVIADEFREDLSPAGKRSGWCGFHLHIPADCESGSYRVRARDGESIWYITEYFSHEEQPRVVAPTPGIDGRLADEAGALGYLDEAGPRNVKGWLSQGTPFLPPRHIDLVADGTIVASSVVNLWRNDLEDHNQGDGRVGFVIEIPPRLRDGCDHEFDLRWAGSQTSLLRKPVTVRTEQMVTKESDARPRVDFARPAADTQIELSVVVNFHNMHREAQRTLASLSRSFQRDVADLAYEVVCIDNGSSPAMAEEAITQHGPEFRLFRPSVQHPSPVFAINEAAQSARGRYVAVMIDGAHLLSPGVLAEAIAALRSETRAMIAIRHWFIGGDQRWLSAVGYSREHEDIPFAKIGWPHCGYDVFKISAPIFDSPNTWFDSMSESNCLFLSTADFTELGGYDEAFTMPGGEFANLDLFARAASLPDMTVVALIGEATFHQYHAGTTTNVTDAEKEKRVRRYANSFETLRSRSYDPVDRSRLVFRGGMHNDYAMNARQRPTGKVRLGLTSAIRELPVSRVFEEGAQTYAHAAYIESGAYRASIWAGQSTGVAPADLLEIQQILWAGRPDVLVLKDVAPGLLAFIQSILPAVKLEGLMPIWVTKTGDMPTPPGVRRIIGDIADPETHAHLEAEIGANEGVSVLFQSREDEVMPIESMRRYSAFVSVAGHLVVLGAAFGQPTIGYSRLWLSNAIHRLLKSDSAFVVDHTMNAHFITTCPSGFLRRRADLRPNQPYNQGLDALEEFEIA